MRSLFLVLSICLFTACPGDDDDAPRPTTCEYEGETYQLEQTFPAGDGCNTCACLPQGDGAGAEVQCTAIGCVIDAGIDAGHLSGCDAGCSGPDASVDASPNDP